MAFRRVTVSEGDGRLVLDNGDAFPTSYCVNEYQDVAPARRPPVGGEARRRFTGYFRFVEDVVPHLSDTSDATLELADGRMGRVVFHPPRQPLRIVEFVASDFDVVPWIAAAVGT